jgi:hypothetical protein
LRRIIPFALVAGLVILPTTTLLMLGSAGAQISAPTVNFSGLAEADGFEATLSNPSIPLALVVEGAGPTAQANLTSTQESDGFASFPYPGQDVITLPGLASGAFLAGFPVPAYPLYTQTTYGDQPSNVDFPGIDLSSESNLSDCNASAVVGTSAIGMVSKAEVEENSDSSVTASSSASINGFALGSLLSITGVVSTASEVLTPDGTFTPTSSLSIGDITVPGLNLTLPTTTPTAVGIPIPIPGLPQLPRLSFPAIPIPLGGTTIASPHIGLDDGQFTITLPFLGKSQTFALPVQTVLNFFKLAGVNIAYEAAQTTANGVISPALTISTTLPAPPANNYVNGATPINLTIGLSSASIQGSETPPPSDDFGSGTESTGSSLSSGGNNFGFPTLGSTFGSGTGSSSGASSATSAPSTVSPSTESLALVGKPHPLSSVYDLYFVLIAIGVMGTLSANFLRYLGVRKKWKS